VDWSCLSEPELLGVDSGLLLLLLLVELKDIRASLAPSITSATSCRTVAKAVEETDTLAAIECDGR